MFSDGQTIREIDENVCDGNQITGKMASEVEIEVVGKKKDVREIWVSSLASKILERSMVTSLTIKFAERFGIIILMRWLSESSSI